MQGEANVGMMAGQHVNSAFDTRTETVCYRMFILHLLLLPTLPFPFALLV